MPATLYRSTDSGAPALMGSNASSLITVLDAILVNGYGSKPAAGWTKEFTGTNKAVYRNGASAVARRYFRFNDPGSVADINVRGYYSMTDVDTGTGAFPNDFQNPNLLVVRKASSTNDPNAKPWVAVADARTLLLFINHDGTNNNWLGYYFGDAVPVLSSDLGFSVCAALYQTTVTPGLYGYISHFGGTTSDTTYCGMYIGGDLSGASSSRLAYALAPPGRMAIGVSFGGTGASPTMNYPLPDGSLPMFESLIAEITQHSNPPVWSIRGRFRFVYCVPVAPGASLANDDTFTGIGEMSGKSFLIRKKLFNKNFAGSTDTPQDTLAITLDD